MTPRVRKTPLFEPFIYIKTIILPRQARDKHRETAQKRVAFCADDDGDETLESCAAADAALCSGKTLTPGDSDSCEVTGGGACTWSAAQVESCVATDLDACAAVAAAVPNGDASLCLSASSVASQARLAVGEAVCVYTPGTTSCVGCEKRHFLSTFYIK
jgi:hypothetical protein